MDDFERLREAGILSLPKHNGNEEETDGGRQKVANRAGRFGGRGGGCQKNK